MAAPLTFQDLPSNNGASAAWEGQIALHKGNGESSSMKTVVTDQAPYLRQIEELSLREDLKEEEPRGW